MRPATSKSRTSLQLLLNRKTLGWERAEGGIQSCGAGSFPGMVFCVTLISIAAAVAPRYLDAQDSHGVPPASSSTMPAPALAGKDIFQQKCGFCHGADGSGGQGPDLLHSSLMLHDENGDLITPVVQGGRADKGMPAFNLAASQIQQIAAFLHGEIKADATIFYTNSTAGYSLNKMLVGNAEAGKVYFNGAGKCSQCHSPTGDLAHIASKYPPIKLQSRIAYPAGATPTLTVTLPSGTNVSGVQVHLDRFFVSLRDSDGWVQSFDRSKVKVEVRNPLAEHQKLLETYTNKQLHDLFAYLETLK